MNLNRYSKKMESSFDSVNVGSVIGFVGGMVIASEFHPVATFVCGVACSVVVEKAWDKLKSRIVDSVKQQTR